MANQPATKAKRQSTRKAVEPEHPHVKVYFYPDVPKMVEEISPVGKVAFVSPPKLAEQMRSDEAIPFRFRQIAALPKHNEAVLGVGQAKRHETIDGELIIIY